MSSDKRIRASRENGRKGGVKTLAGKRRSSRNAVKFGIYSKQHLVAGTECQYLHDHLREKFFEEYKPVGPTEVELVESLVHHTWVIRRHRSTGTWMLEKKMFEQCAELEKRWPNPDPGARVAKAMESLMTDSDAYDKQARYEARLERTRMRLIKSLLATQNDRLLKSGAQIKNCKNEPRSAEESAPVPAEETGLPPENWSPEHYDPDQIPFQVEEPAARASYNPPRSLLRVKAA